MRRFFVLIVLTFFMTMSVSSQDNMATNISTVEELADLDFDAFLEESYLLLLRRDPEAIIQLGLQADLNFTEAILTNVSDAYALETEAMVRDVLAQLQSRDRDALTVEQQISYDIYVWFLDDLVRAQEFRLYEFWVTSFITGVPRNTSLFFTDIHPMETPQDAADYVARLWLVNAKFEQVLERVDMRTEAGIVPPQFAIQFALGGLNRLSGGRVEQHEYYAVLAEKLADISDLSEDERDTLLAEAAEAVEQSVMVGYAQLADKMDELLVLAPQTIGSWQYPNGDAYYDYMLRHFTTTDLSADEIHELGLSELERIHAEMRDLFGELGFDSEQSITELYRQLPNNGDIVLAADVVPTFEALLADAQANLGDAFSYIPEAEVVIIGDTSGGFYIPAALDGSRPGAFYANNTGARTYFNMPSLLYHETVPGHHFQIAWAQERDLPFLQRSPQFTAYIEGWALYAERLALELGWYEDDPAGDLGRLQFEAFRAARLVVDTGVHAKQWSFNEAAQFFAENTGFSNNMAQGQIARYVIWPGQATAYMIGMLEILDLRQQSQTALGDDFNLADFHDVILDSGSVPLDVLHGIVADYLEPEE